mmetsp:Transcript_29081/g.93177  ORF Transcript_29081/g.93177 Transcript_29081/m.93177 type:complete len:392 (+) Transcript_29081:113-1288(+)
MESRKIGLLIALVGMLGATPDAMLLRLENGEGATSSTILIWRYLLVGAIQFVIASSMSGKRGLLRASTIAPKCNFAAALLVMASNLGFVFSLLWVEPAKSLLLISLNSLWAALLGYAVCGDELPARTALAQGGALVSLAVVFIPNCYELKLDVLDLIPLATGIAMAAYLTLARFVALRLPRCSLDLSPALGSLASIGFAVAMQRTMQPSGHASGSGLTPRFFLLLSLNAAGIALYNTALVLCPRFITGAECALVLLGETVLGPVWVFFAFGDAPDPFTVYGGALLLLTLLVHEVAAMRAASLAPDGPAGSDSVDSTSGSLFERSPHARPQVSPPISRGGTLYRSPRAEPASALLLPASLGQPLLPEGALSGGGAPLRRPEAGEGRSESDPG